VQIALVHGSDEDRCPPNKRATAPFRAAEVTAAGASLLLTGHYHGGYVVNAKGRPVFAYPGSPEPIKFGEGATHGALVVTVEGGSIRIEPFATAKTRLVDLSCALDGATSEHAALASVETALEPYGALDYVRLNLTGSVAPGTRLDTELMEGRFGPALGSLSIVDATIAHDYAAIAREPTVRGHVVSDLLAGGDASADALRYALAAFDGAEIAP
jgi:DNA repair exonuclease SbcCD nuclease subunit